MIIGHFQGLWELSGVGSTVGALMREQQAQGHSVYYLDYASSEGFVREHGSCDPYVLVDDDRELFERADALDLDVLHVHHPISGLPPGHVPVVRTVHNFQPLCPSVRHFLGRTGAECHRTYSPLGCLWGHAVDACGPRRPDRWLEGFRKTWQDQTVLPQIYTATVSRMLKDALVDGGYPADRIEVTPMFTTRNEAPFAPPPEDDVPRFLYLGALLEQKGIGVLLEAVANARRPVHLDIAGTGPYKKVLQERIDTLGIRERVTFHGWVNAAARTELLAGARALVVPSIAPETAGAVAVEAAAQGRAVIASAIGGLPEYARHGETAIVVPPGDEEALAIALDQLAGDWSLAAQLGRCGYDVAQEVFTIDYHLQQLYDLYHRSIQEQVGSGTAQQSIKPSFS